MILIGEELEGFCARIAAEGKYIRRLECVGRSCYRVRQGDILAVPAGRSMPAPASAQLDLFTKNQRCDETLAQLWFDVMKGGS